MNHYATLLFFLFRGCSLLHFTCAFTKVIVPAFYKEYEKGFPFWITNQTVKDQYNYTTFLYQKLNPNVENYIATNRGSENGAYYRYIVDHYDNFPDVAIFVHAHPHDHQAHWLQMVGCISPNASYISLNDNPRNRLCRYTAYWKKYEIWIEQCWRDTLDIVWGINGNVTELNRLVPIDRPIGVCMICCQQFIISRAMVHKRPLSVWKKLLNKLAEDDVCHVGEPNYANNHAFLRTQSRVGKETTHFDGDHTGRYTQGLASEHLAHVIFGHQPLDMEWPSMETNCENFIPNCPGSPCVQ